MKTFNYTVRETSGGIKRGILQADNRTAALHELKARGVVPIAITEGAAKDALKHPNKKSFILAGGMIAAILVGVFIAFKLLPGPSRQKARETINAKKQVAKKTATKTTKKPDVASSNVVKSVESHATQSGTLESVEKLKNKVAASNEPDPNVVMVVWPTNETTRVFEREIEFRMAQYIHAGQRPSPPPPMTQTNLDEMAKEALKKNIVVYEEDSEAVYATKEAVAKMKEELRQYMAQGGKATDFFKGLADRQKTEADMALDARSIITELTKQGQIEEAKQALTEINAYLSERGQPAVIVPPPYRKALGLAPRVEVP